MPIAHFLAKLVDILNHALAVAPERVPHDVLPPAQDFGGGRFVGSRPGQFPPFPCGLCFQFGPLFRFGGLILAQEKG